MVSQLCQWFHQRVGKIRAVPGQTYSRNALYRGDQHDFNYIYNIYFDNINDFNVNLNYQYNIDNFYNVDNYCTTNYNFN